MVAPAVAVVDPVADLGRGCAHLDPATGAGHPAAGAVRAVRYGNARLKQELRQHGISDDDIAAALPEGGDEVARCQAVWARKFGRLPVDATERGRQMRFLQYRGFSGEAIRGVMRGADE